MKKIFLHTFLLLLGSVSVFAQGSAGLIAHWDMNGETNDVSGAGNNGHGQNIVPAAGMDGVMGHGYLFNGSNSMITVPYSPTFNVQKFTICATVNAHGFYSGTCQHNCILTRGKTGPGVGNYFFTFGDHAVDLDCNSFDSTIDVFMTELEARTFTGTAFVYTPHITEDTWYKVVTTFDDTAVRTWVDGVLKNTSHLVSPGVPLGTSTDSISIGFNVFEAANGFPYPFKGVMDDLRFYNRVLTDSEIIHYGPADSCGVVTLQPHDTVGHVGSTVTFTTLTSIADSVFQWQQDAGTGFSNLSNAGPYSGVTTNMLTITGVTTALASDNYRCIVSNVGGCTDTTVSAKLIVPVGVNNYYTNEMISVFPNPAQNQITIQVPGIEKGSVSVLNKLGQIVERGDIMNKECKLEISKLPADMYIIQIDYNGQIFYKKVEKY